MVAGSSDDRSKGRLVSFQIFGVQPPRDSSRGSSGTMKEGYGREERSGG